MRESIAKIIAWVAWALLRYGVIKVLGFGTGQELAVIGIGSDQTAVPSHDWTTCIASLVRLCSEFSSEAVLQLCAIAAAEFGTNVPHLERTDTQTSTKSSKSTKDKNIESKNIIEKIPDSQTSEAFTIGMAELAKLWNQEREFLTLEVWAIMMSEKEERFGEFVLWTKLNRTRVAIVEAI